MRKAAGDCQDLGPGEGEAEAQPWEGLQLLVGT